VYFSPKTPEDVIRSIKDHKIQMVDLRFTDLQGLWHRFSVPTSTVDVKSFEDGIGYDGSSIRWLQEIQEGDVLLIADAASAFLDPFAEGIQTLVLLCNVRDPETGRNYTRDPRHISQKAEAYLQTSELGDTVNFGLELDRFVVDVMFGDQSIDFELLGNVRTQICDILEKIGIKFEIRDHLDEICILYANLTRMADNLMVLRYVVENVVRRCGMTDFMPKVLGNKSMGMHVCQSIWQGGRPLFAGDGYAGSSALMRHYFAGLLEHAPAVLAVCAPTADFHRLQVPSIEASVVLDNSQLFRSASCRIPTYSPNPKARHIEFLCPNSSCNPYLTFAAMLMAGIDGFHERLYSLDPGEPIEKIYDLPPQGSVKVSPALGSLGALETDHTFLLKGDVFTPDLIETQLGNIRALDGRATAPATSQ
jgi:glutamine synthetase